MRLFDADALKLFIKQNGYLYANTLDTFPTVDAVPVVKCRECKNYAGAKIGGFCELNESYWEEENFCSYGERKEPTND